jgi:cell division protein FtsQ
MLFLGRRMQRDPRTDVHRRRAVRKIRRSPRLRRLLFFWRKNRRVTPPSGVVASAPEGGAVETQRVAGPEPGRREQYTLALLLRLLLSLLLCALVVGAGMGGMYFLKSSPSFAIRTVRISPTRHVPGTALRERAGISLGQNLIRLDLGRVQAALAQEPWLRSVRVRRELPATVAIDVTEYEPQALVALGSLYLSDGEGVLFKRATPEEASGLPVITGISRDGYVADRAEAQALIRLALAVLATYRAGPASRPPVGEIHIDDIAGITLYTAGGVAVRLGPSERAAPAEWVERLRRFDAVLRELSERTLRPAAIFLDNRAHPDHITVRLEER